MFQWLFLIDGIFTLLIGILFILLMPRSTANTAPLCRLNRLNFFNDAERRLLANRVILDDPRKAVGLSDIGFKKVARVLLTNFRIWGHFSINLISLTPKGGLATYAPTIIKNLGFSSITASNLSSVSNFGVCVFAIVIAWVSDKTSLRGPLCLLCGIYSLVFAGVQYSIVHSKDAWLKYAILTIFNSGTAVSQGINDAWFSINTPDPQERCIGLALAVAGSNLGGLSGQNIFLKNDAPYYHNGFLKILCIYGASIVIVAGMILYYWNENRLLAKGSDDVVSDDGAEAVATNGGAVKVKNQL